MEGGFLNPRQETLNLFLSFQQSPCPGLGTLKSFLSRDSALQKTSTISTYMASATTEKPGHHKARISMTTALTIPPWAPRNHYPPPQQPFVRMQILFHTQYIPCYIPRNHVQYHRTLTTKWSTIDDDGQYSFIPPSMMPVMNSSLPIQLKIFFMQRLQANFLLAIFFFKLHLIS